MCSLSCKLLIHHILSSTLCQKKEKVALKRQKITAYLALDPLKPEDYIMSGGQIKPVIQGIPVTIYI